MTFSYLLITQKMSGFLVRQVFSTASYRRHKQ